MFSTIAITSLSMWIAGIIALIRLNKISAAYWPFIICIWLACINDLLSYLLAVNGYFTNFNNNIYVLCEALLYVLFYAKIRFLNIRSGLFYALIVFFIVFWITENWLFNQMFFISSWFRIAYSFFIVLMSIILINKIALPAGNEFFGAFQGTIYRNPVFLICLGSMVFFTFKLLVEIFWLYGLNRSDIFRVKLYEILIFINLGANLIYALAILWMPSKRQYIMR